MIIEKELIFLRRLSSGDINNYHVKYQVRLIVLVRGVDLVFLDAPSSSILILKNIKRSSTSFRIIKIVDRCQSLKISRDCQRRFVSLK